MEIRFSNISRRYQSDVHRIDRALCDAGVPHSYRLLADEHGSYVRLNWPAGVVIVVEDGNAYSLAIRRAYTFFEWPLRHIADADKIAQTLRDIVFSV